MGETIAVTAAEIAELLGLVADVTGTAAGPAVPFAAPLLLFSRLDAGRRDALFAPRPGRVLVQEQLAIEASGRLVAGEPVEVCFRFGEPVSDVAPFRIEADLVDVAGATVAALRTSIRPIEATQLAAATGLPMAASPDTVGRATTRPLGADPVGRWLHLVGDVNPIHTDADHARALGLDGPVLPGALFAAAAEVLADAGPDATLVRLNMRFMAPIAVGATVATRLRERPAEGATGRRDMRLFFLVGDRAAAVADLGFAATAARPVSP
ncbi:MaoC family dehydratase [Pinisolibacter sp.]|uniref:MaoC family dehydratase n=1 Tax=Pinisolibacter sp. TaxID=2172024 RepID=UPI002FDE57EC